MRVSAWGAAPALELARQRRRGAGARARARSCSTARSCEARMPARRAPRRARARAGPALCALPESTLLVPPGWSGEVDEQGTIRAGEDARRDEPRPDRAAGDHGRAAGGVRGDGRGADPLGALGEHQGAPRRLDRPVRRGRPDGDAGRAHPGAPRRDAGGGGGGARARTTRRASRGSSTTRSPAARTCRTSRSSRPCSPAGDAPRLRGQPRPPRRRRRARPGLDAGGQQDAGGRGRGDLAAAADATRRSRSSCRRCASRAERAADLRAQLAANRVGAVRLASWRERVGAERLREATDAVLDYAERRTRACLAAMRGRRLRSDGRAGGGRGRPRAAPARRGARRAPDARLHRQRSPARGQPELPAGGDALGVLLRGAGADRPGHPPDARARTARSRCGPRGHAC